MTMAEPQKIPTLAEAFMVSLIQPLIKKPLFGKRRLPLANFLTVGGFLFETGAVLGWAYRDRQLAFERVIGQPETAGQLVRLMRLKAKERMAESKSQDDSLARFVYETEVARLGHPMEWTSIEGMKRFTDWLQKQSLDLDTAYSELQILFYEGVGYGFEFPEETQRRWKAVYEKPKTPDDLISWHMAYQYSVVTTPEPAPIQTWDERVSELKDALREYITEFKPELNSLFTTTVDDSEPEIANRQTEGTASSVTPMIGVDIKWAEIIGHVFRVLDFDRSGTTIDQNGKVISKSRLKPYGYLLVESPILGQSAGLPIVHRDDFGLAASVYDVPAILEFVKENELLVTYLPKRKLPGGFAGLTHALHYVITEKNTLEKYYEIGAGVHRARPEPEKIFEHIAWEGELKVQLNLNPKL